MHNFPRLKQDSLNQLNQEKKIKTTNRHFEDQSQKGELGSTKNQAMSQASKASSSQITMNPVADH